MATVLCRMPICTGQRANAISNGLLCHQVYFWEKTILSESGVRRAESAKIAFRFPLSAPRTPRLAKTHGPDDVLMLGVLRCASLWL
jgi:hypothetical protein